MSASVIGVYRTRVRIVQAYRDEAGRVQVIGESDPLTVDEFNTMFEPARPEDLLKELAPPATNGHAKKAKARAVKAKPVAKAKGTGPGKRATAEQWQQARGWWVECVPVKEIAKRLGVSDQGVRYHARAHKWPKQEANPDELTRVCPKCEQRVKGNPCPVCKTPR